MRFWQKHLFLTEAHKDIFLSLSLPFFHLLAQRLPLLSGRRSVVASVCQSHISCNKAFATHSSLKLAQWMCVRILYIIRSEKVLQPNPCCDGLCDCTNEWINKCKDSLNPGFNGRCTRTALELLYQHLHIKGLNPCSNGRCTRTMNTYHITYSYKQS